MKIDAKKFLALTQLMAMPLVTASTGCIINTDDDGTTGNDSVGDGSTGGSNSTTATSSATGASASGGSGDGSTGADGSEGTGGTGGTAAEAGTGGTAAEAGTGGSDETAGADPEGCCVVHPTPGCSDDAIETCVCAMDALCCDAVEGAWDDICVSEVAQFGCGTCE